MPLNDFGSTFPINIRILLQVGGSKLPLPRCMDGAILSETRDQALNQLRESSRNNHWNVEPHSIVFLVSRRLSTQEDPSMINTNSGSKSKSATLATITGLNCRASKFYMLP